ncbi:MAG: hypothetical protein PHY28_02090 [Dehalococcoidales bacterium]|nr:hypothetical protein [Dehalococcoidales bacterium]
MLEMRKTAVSFDERDLMELERIVTDGDEKEALRFVKKSVYDRINNAQQSRLKSHLDTGGDPTKQFKGQNRAG